MAEHSRGRAAGKNDEWITKRLTGRVGCIVHCQVMQGHGLEDLADYARATNAPYRGLFWPDTTLTARRRTWPAWIVKSGTRISVVAWPSAPRKAHHCGRHVCMCLITSRVLLMRVEEVVSGQFRRTSARPLTPVKKPSQSATSACCFTGRI
jgi:hypothetical protein